MVCREVGGETDVTGETDLLKTGRVREVSRPCTVGRGPYGGMTGHDGTTVMWEVQGFVVIQRTGMGVGILRHGSRTWCVLVYRSFVQGSTFEVLLDDVLGDGVDMVVSGKSTVPPESGKDSVLVTVSQVVPCPRPRTPRTTPSSVGVRVGQERVHQFAHDWVWSSPPKTPLLPKYVYWDRSDGKPPHPSTDDGTGRQW